MDKIILKKLKFQGRHGCFPEEKLNFQNFIITGELFLDLEEAMISDNLEKTVNYGEVYEIIKNQVTQKSYDLIEKLAAEILKDIFAYSELINEINIKIIKPKPPVEGQYDYFAVEIRRTRKWQKLI